MSGGGNVRSGQCLSGEISSQGSVQSRNCPVGELSVRGNVHRRIVHGEVSVGELSSRRTVRIPINILKDFHLQKSFRLGKNNTYKIFPKRKIANVFIFLYLMLTFTYTCIDICLYAFLYIYR